MRRHVAVAAITAITARRNDSVGVRCKTSNKDDVLMAEAVVVEFFVEQED